MRTVLLRAERLAAPRRRTPLQRRRRGAPTAPVAVPLPSSSAAGAAVSLQKTAEGREEAEGTVLKAAAAAPAAAAAAAAAATAAAAGEEEVLVRLTSADAAASMAGVEWEEWEEVGMGDVPEDGREEDGQWEPEEDCAEVLQGNARPMLLRLPRTTAGAEVNGNTDDCHKESGSVTSAGSEDTVLFCQQETGRLVLVTRHPNADALSNSASAAPCDSAREAPATAATEADGEGAPPPSSAPPAPLAPGPSKDLVSLRVRERDPALRSLLRSAQTSIAVRRACFKTAQQPGSPHHSRRQHQQQQESTVAAAPQVVMVNAESAMFVVAIVFETATCLEPPAALAAAIESQDAAPSSPNAGSQTADTESVTPSTAAPAPCAPRVRMRAQAYLVHEQAVVPNCTCIAQVPPSSASSASTCTSLVLGTSDGVVSWMEWDSRIGRFRECFSYEIDGPIHSIGVLSLEDTTLSMRVAQQQSQPSMAMAEVLFVVGTVTGLLHVLDPNNPTAPLVAMESGGGLPLSPLGWSGPIVCSGGNLIPPVLLAPQTPSPPVPPPEPPALAAREATEESDTVLEATSDQNQTLVAATMPRLVHPGLVFAVCAVDGRICLCEVVRHPEDGSLRYYVADHTHTSDGLFHSDFLPGSLPGESPLFFCLSWTGKGYFLSVDAPPVCFDGRGVIPSPPKAMVAACIPDAAPCGMPSSSSTSSSLVIAGADGSLRLYRNIRKHIGFQARTSRPGGFVHGWRLWQQERRMRAQGASTNEDVVEQSAEPVQAVGDEDGRDVRDGEDTDEEEDADAEEENACIATYGESPEAAALLYTVIGESATDVQKQIAQLKTVLEQLRRDDDGRSPAMRRTLQWLEQLVEETVDEGNLVGFLEELGRLRCDDISGTVCA